MGKPLNEKSFNLFKVGDINVYVIAGAKVAERGLKISFSKLLWIKNLNVDGLMV